MQRIIRSLMMASALLVAACGGSNTSIEQSWQPSTAHASLHRVATIMMSKDVTTRHTAEDAMAQRLRAQGVTATPGYAVLTDDDYANRLAAKAKLVAQGFDGVIAMRLISKDQQVTYTPGFDGYWGYGYGYGGGGYLDTETQVRVETSAYSLVDEALVYSATSNTVDPSNVNSVISGVTTTVAQALQKKGVVAAGPSRAIPQS